MKNLITVIVLILAGALSVNAQKVKVWADPGVDMSKYKTYAWAQGAMVANAMINELVVTAVDSQIQAKGLKKVQTDPDLLLVTWASTQSELYTSNPSSAPSLNSISTGIAGGSQSWPVTKGTLVINLSDARTKDGVWRGTATHTLEYGPSGNMATDARRAEKPIKKAVEKMFKQFPRPK